MQHLRESPYTFDPLPKTKKTPVTTRMKNLKTSPETNVVSNHWDWKISLLFGMAPPGRVQILLVLRSVLHV